MDGNMYHCQNIYQERQMLDLRWSGPSREMELPHQTVLLQCASLFPYESSTLASHIHRAEAIKAAPEL
jgi:hypothetical protein